jgi:hypothetical protein
VRLFGLRRIESKDVRSGSEDVRSEDALFSKEKENVRSAVR